MKKVILTLILLLLISYAFSQKNNAKSILFVNNLNFDNNKFNKTLKKEIASKTLYLYTFDDLYKNGALIKSYKKPISKYAYENYREIEFYKKALPKEVDLINFQKGIKTK